VKNPSYTFRNLSLIISCEFIKEEIGVSIVYDGGKHSDNSAITYNYVAAKATYIRLLLWQNGGFSALAP